MANNVSSVGFQIGPVAVSTTGTANSSVLTALQALISKYGTSTTFGGNTVYTPTAPVSLSLNSTTPGVVTNSNATLTGGGPSTIIISDGPAADLEYSGAAGNIFADGTGNIFSTAQSATITAGAGSYTVVGVGSGDNYILGSSASTVTAHAFGTANTATLQGGVSYFAGGADTIFATSGSSSVYAFGATTSGGTGNIGGFETFFASGTNLFSSLNDASTFIGGTGADTIFTTASRDLIYVGATSDLVVTRAGADSLVGGSVAPTVFAGTGEDAVLVSTAVSGVLVDNGKNATIDGSRSLGGNNYFASASYGAGTLIGAAAGAADSFYFTSDTTSGATITIQNFRVGDSVILTGFSAADTAKAATSVSTGTFTLSDGTTVTFVGTHPSGGTNGHLT